MSLLLRTSRPVALIACALSLFASASRAPSVTSAGPVQILRLPAGALQPSVAVDQRGVAHAVYFSGSPAHGDVFYTRFDQNGDMSHAVQVNTEAGSAIATGNVRGARLAVGRDERVHVVWTGANSRHMWYTHSRAEGGFVPERNVHQLEGPLDGGSVAADLRGHVYVIWHGELPGGKGEENRRAWVARSDDEGQTFDREEAASPAAIGACGCCGTAGATAPDGTLYLLYRSSREAVHRDTVLLSSRDYGRNFAARDLHEWNVPACPMSTFSIAAAAGTVVTAWETAGQIYWTRVKSAGKEPPVPIAVPGTPGGRKHPAIAQNKRGETLVAWTEGMGWSRGGTVLWQLYDKGGAPVGEPAAAGNIPAWSLIAAYARADGGFTLVF